MGLETCFIFLVSVAFFAVSPPAVHVKLLNFFHPSTIWEKRAETISLILVGYGILLLALAGFSYVAHRKGGSLTARVWQSLRAAPASLRKMLAAFVERQDELGSLLAWPLLVLAIGAGVRGYFLSQPMRGDEAYTFLNFANQDFFALFDYALPNNHVLNTLLIKISTIFWGASPATIRLPAFLAGLAIIPLTFSLARALHPRGHSGILATLTVAVFPYLILYSTNARGYTLLVALTLAIALVGLRYTRRPSAIGVIFLAALSALGMWTIPSMLIGIAGIFCWLVALLLLNKRPLQTVFYEFALPFGLLSGIFTFVLYTPVIFVSNGVEAIIANKFVESQSWPEFFIQILPQLQQTFDEISRDVPPVFFAAGFILVILGLYRSLQKREWGVFLLLPGIILGAVIVLLIQHVTPYARLWIYTLPFIFLMADYGLTGVLERFPAKIQTLTHILVVASGAFFAIQLMSANVIAKYPDTSAFPEAPLVAQYLKPILTPEDAVRVTNTADWPVFFYFWYYDMPMPIEKKPSSTGKTFIIVKKSRYMLENMTDKPVIQLLDFGDMALYQAVEP